MINVDDLLQKQLEALETGTQTADSPAQPDGMPAELAPLLQLARAVRQLPHPALAPEKIHAQRLALASAARQLAGPKPRPWQLPWLKITDRQAAFPLIAAGALLVLFAFLGLLAGGLWWLGPRAAHAATLIETNGSVEVASSSTAADWRPAESGDRVHTGQRLRTRAASGVTLVFFDGSRTILGPNSDVTLITLDGDWGSVLRVALTLNNGKATSSVVPLHGQNSSFMVHTPAGAASVHGTRFSVAVGTAGRARFTVDSGKVLVSNAESRVTLIAGQATTAGPGQNLEDPAYQFELEGDVTAMDGSSWAVDGVAFQLVTDTLISGNPLLGDFVEVEGRVLANNAWVADSITRVEAGEPESSFTGTLITMSGASWQVSGHAVLIDDQTELDGGLAVGSPVKVTFTVLPDGQWMARRIRLLEESPAEPTPTPSATPDQAAEPLLSFEPGQLDAEGCGPKFKLTGTLVNTATEPGDYAANVILGYEVTGGADYLSAIQLDPSSWERIEAGQSVPFAIKVMANQAWVNAPQGSQINLRIFVANEVNRPSEQHTYLEINLYHKCEATPTPTETSLPSATATPTLTVTPTLTATPVVTATATATPSLTTTAVTDCTGADPHPHGQQLALQYGVPYEEIMGWFCQGFGFGEIVLAYDLSLETGVPVADIFAMKSSGLGWGQIKQQLVGKPGKGKEPTVPEPTKEHGKSKKDK